MNEATFQISTGNKYVNIRVVTRGFPLEHLFELDEGEDLGSSVFLRIPQSSEPSEIRSFLTAMNKINVVSEEFIDGLIEITLGNNPSLNIDNGMFKLVLSPNLIKNPKDRRRTLAGNLGLLYSLSLFLLEKKHKIVSYHASALVDERNKLVYINGGDASTGKSVIMLDYMSYYGSNSEYRVLSTEMGHFSIIEDEMVFYTGACFDNIAIFPGELEKIKLMNNLFPVNILPDPDSDVETRGTDGSVKTAISMKDYFARKQTYSSLDGYKLIYLMPTINPGYKTLDPVILPRENYNGILSSLVGVARQKLGQKQPSWIYDEKGALFLPVRYLAAEEEMETKTIEKSLQKDFLKAVIKIKGNPIDFNKNPGVYWGKIASLLGLS
jgi:hypothetical protein